MKKDAQIPIRSTWQPTVLRFSPTAWAKLLYLRDAGDTEIGGFGIAAADDLLFVEDVQLVAQTSSWADAAFDDQSVADFFDAQVDAGRRPEEFGRLFMHTHPGNSPQPSSKDEATFARVFGRTDWAVLFILARGGQTYARLRFNVGPGTDVLIPVDIDYGRSFGGSDAERWHAEYLANVRTPPPELPKTESAAERPAPLVGSPWDDDRDFGQPPADWPANRYDDWFEYMDFERSSQEAEYGYIRDFD